MTRECGLGAECTGLEVGAVVSDDHGKPPQGDGIGFHPTRLIGVSPVAFSGSIDELWGYCKLIPRAIFDLSWTAITLRLSSINALRIA